MSTVEECIHHIYVEQHTYFISHSVAKLFICSDEIKHTLAFEKV